MITEKNVDYWCLTNSITRIVVAAACRTKDGLVVVSPRHFDPLMHKTIQAICPDKEERKLIKWDQGFVCQFGCFMGRQHALEVAKRSGQPLSVTSGCGDDLYSECLY